MVRYAYELIHKNKIVEINVQNHFFTEEVMLKTAHECPYEEYHDVVKVKFYKRIPDGYHLCGCGNLVEGTDDHELCDECKEVYGHDYDFEL